MCKMIKTLLAIVLAAPLLLAGCGNVDTPLRGYPDNYLQGQGDVAP